MRIAAPAAFAPALRAVGRLWACKGRPEPDWTFNAAFGAYPSVTARLEAGEAFDLVVLPESALRIQAREGRILSDGIRTAFRAGIAVAVPHDGELADVASAQSLREVLLRARRIACSRASSGTHLCERVLPALGLDLGDRLVQVDSGDVAAELAAGRADLGFQLLCELVGRPGITIVGPLPSDLQQHVVAGIGIATAAESLAAARSFSAWLCGCQAWGALTEAGLEPAT